MPQEISGQNILVLNKNNWSKI